MEFRRIARFCFYFFRAFPLGSYLIISWVLNWIWQKRLNAIEADVFELSQRKKSIIDENEKVASLQEVYKCLEKKVNEFDSYEAHKEELMKNIFFACQELSTEPCFVKENKINIDRLFENYNSLLALLKNKEARLDRLDQLLYDECVRELKDIEYDADKYDGTHPFKKRLVDALKNFSGSILEKRSKRSSTLLQDKLSELRNNALRELQKVFQLPIKREKVLSEFGLQKERFLKMLPNEKICNIQERFDKIQDEMTNDSDGLLERLPYFKEKLFKLIEDIEGVQASNDEDRGKKRSLLVEMQKFYEIKFSQTDQVFSKEDNTGLHASNNGLSHSDMVNEQLNQSDVSSNAKEKGFTSSVGVKDSDNRVKIEASLSGENRDYVAAENFTTDITLGDSVIGNAIDAKHKDSVSSQCSVPEQDFVVIQNVIPSSVRCKEEEVFAEKDMVDATVCSVVTQDAAPGHKNPYRLEGDDSMDVDNMNSTNQGLVNESGIMHSSTRNLIYRREDATDINITDRTTDECMDIDEA